MAELLGGGEEIVRRLAELNLIPLAVLRESPLEQEAWQQAAGAAIAGLLGQPAGPTGS